MREFPRSRRAFLTTGATLSALSVAGCLGDGGDGGEDGDGTTDDTPTEASPDSDEDDGEDDDGSDPEDDGGDGGDEPVEDLPDPYMGNPDADVVVAAWEDFGCGACRSYEASVVPELQQEYVSDDLIRYERHDYPIPVGSWSWETAMAARSVQDRVGRVAFWKFTQGAYQRQSEMDLVVMGEIAENVGADGSAVQDDVNDEVYRPVVEDSRKRGKERGVTGTPAVFVNGEEVTNSYTAISSAIDAALE